MYLYIIQKLNILILPEWEHTEFWSEQLVIDYLVLKKKNIKNL